MSAKMDESSPKKLASLPTRKGLDENEKLWYANCICLADILDSDHDLSRKGQEKNPLESYWQNYNEKNTDVLREYNNIFKPGTRTQTRIHKMFEELIETFGSRFQNIDGDNIPRIALTKGKIVSKKDLSSQRSAIYEDSEKAIEHLMVETHRGGDYMESPNPVFLYKAKSSTVFDLGSNAGFKDYNEMKVQFSNNYFPKSSTAMIKYESKEVLKQLYTDAKWEQFVENNIDKTTFFAVGQLLLVHIFEGTSGPTYSIQFGPVTADEVTYELYGENRRSLICHKTNRVKNMILSVNNDEDELARKCHIVYGKTCGDGVAVDAAEQMKCGVLSNDICCCYRAAIVNGVGFRPCPTAAKFFSTERVVEVFQTKPKGVFNVEKARENVGKLLESLKGIVAAKKERTDYVNGFSVEKEGKKIMAFSVIFNMKKTQALKMIEDRQIPDDLLEVVNNNGSIPDEDILKRYCNYDMDQCIGSFEFYKRELTQFIIYIKSNIELLTKIRLTNRDTFASQVFCFEQCLIIIANIELVFSSFMTDEQILPFSKSFFRANLYKMYGDNFLNRFKEILSKLISTTPQQPSNMSTLMEYIELYEGKKRKREGSSSDSSPAQKRGGAGRRPVLIMSALVPNSELLSGAKLPDESRLEFESTNKVQPIEKPNVEVFEENNYEDVFERLTEGDIIFPPVPSSVLHTRMMTSKSASAKRSNTARSDTTRSYTKRNKMARSKMVRSKTARNIVQKNGKTVNWMTNKTARSFRKAQHNAVPKKNNWIESKSVGRTHNGNKTLTSTRRMSVLTRRKNDDLY